MLRYVVEPMGPTVLYPWTHIQSTVIQYIMLVNQVLCGPLASELRPVCRKGKSVLEYISNPIRKNASVFRVDRVQRNQLFTK